MSGKKLPLDNKLSAKSEKVGGCLIWTGTKSKKGYGLIRIDGTWKLAHRVSYAFYVGEIADGKIIRHSCDTPACINPDHLLIGTQADNMTDMRSRGRSNYAKGADTGNAKITEAQVIEIRATYQRGIRGFGVHVIAKRYGLSKPAVRAILERKSWKHVP